MIKSILLLLLLPLFATAQECGLTPGDQAYVETLTEQGLAEHLNRPKPSDGVSGFIFCCGCDYDPNDPVQEDSARVAHIKQRPYIDANLPWTIYQKGEWLHDPMTAPWWELSKDTTAGCYVTDGAGGYKWTEK